MKKQLPAFAFCALGIGLLLVFAFCGADINQSQRSGDESGISMSLDWPEGYSYNQADSQITVPSSKLNATFPVYVTTITLTISGEGLDPSVVLDVPFDTLSVNFAVTPGMRTFTLLIETSIPGLSFSASQTIDLVPGAQVRLNFNLVINAPPTSDGMTVSNSNPFKNESITITISVTDPDTNDVLTYSWSANGGSVSGSGNSVTWSSGKSGSYSVTVTVDDGRGGSVTANVGITVVNREPVITRVSVDNASPEVGDTVTATCSATDPDDDPLTYSWSNGANGSTVNYTVTTTDSVTLTCTVTDGDGGQASRSVTFNGGSATEEVTTPLLTCASGMVMFTGGTFTMGDDTDGSGGPGDNNDEHTVTLSDFCIDIKEITQAQHQAWGADTTWTTYGFDGNGTVACGTRATCPAESVDWTNAQAYCVAQGKRLPTEAEWEYVARNGGTAAVDAYANGSSTLPPECATGTTTTPGANYNLCNNSGSTSAVGSYSTSSSGLYDMAGNVWEWIGDWYSASYYANGQTDPTGPGSGATRVIRGGGWANTLIGELRSSFRNSRSPASPHVAVGFRCANN